MQILLELATWIDNTRTIVYARRTCTTVYEYTSKLGI